METGRRGGPWRPDALPGGHEARPPPALPGLPTDNEVYFTPAVLPERGEWPIVFGLADVGGGSAFSPPTSTFVESASFRTLSQRHGRRRADATVPDDRSTELFRAATHRQ